MRITILISFILFGALTLGQGPVVTADVSKTSVQEGEVFSYQIVANQDCPITTPDFGDLEVVGGPDKGIHTSSTYGTLGSGTSTQYTYTYHLRANKKGTYPIGPAYMKCKLKKVNSGETITIKVTEGGNSEAGTSSSNYFFKITADKSSVYIGEPFIVTFKYYSTKKPNQIEAIEVGNASGLWREDLNPNRLNYTMTNETIKGQRYFVLELKQDVCIAERAGKITIEPYAASLLNGNDIFNQHREEGRSNSLTIDVKKFPMDTPENFNGLVGTFNLSSSIDKLQLKAGQSLELELIISGTGNMNAFDQPKLTLPESFDVLDPELTSETIVSAQGLKGDLIYKFIITPNEPGTFEIQPFSFSYFDLSERRIKELSTEKFVLEIEKNTSSVVQNPDKGPIIPENTDIQFIHQEKGIDVNLKDFIFGSAAYWGLIVLPPLLVFLLMIARRRKQNKSPESKVESTKKSARKAAQKALSVSLQSLKSGDEKAALKSMQNGFITFLMTKLDLTLSNLSLKTLTQELENRSVKTEILLELTSVWKKIEMAQYAPITTQNMESLIKETQKLIDQLDAAV